jgi:hypothetical protein
MNQGPTWVLLMEKKAGMVLKLSWNGLQSTVQVGDGLSFIRSRVPDNVIMPLDLSKKIILFIQNG